MDILIKIAGVYLTLVAIVIGAHWSLIPLYPTMYDADIFWACVDLLAWAALFIAFVVNIQYARYNKREDSPLDWILSRALILLMVVYLLWYTRNYLGHVLGKEVDEQLWTYIDTIGVLLFGGTGIRLLKDEKTREQLRI